MVKKTILIRCLTIPDKGFGHFNRCLSLGKMLRKKGNVVIFLINQNYKIQKLLVQERFDVLIIPKSLAFQNESEFISKIIKQKNCNSLILDMREFGESLSQKMRNKNIQTILIDDAWCKKAYADMIFSVTMIKQYQKYNVINKKSKIFVGSKFFIVQPEFKKYRKKLSDVKEKKIFNVVVSMGGSDSNQLTLKIVKSILKIPNIRIKIIKGPFFKNLKKLQNLAKNNKRIIVKDFPREIWKDFSKADIVIVAAGSTLFELALQGIPTICIAITKHQIPYAKQFHLNNFAINMGYWKNINYSKLNDVLVLVLSDTKKRKRMCLEGGKILDGKGVVRITNIINSSK